MQQKKLTRSRLTPTIQLNTYQFRLRLLKLEIDTQKQSRHFRLELYKGFQKLFEIETINNDKTSQFRKSEMRFMVDYKEQVRSSYEFNLILYEIIQAKAQHYEVVLAQTILNLKDFINMYNRTKITYFTKNMLISTGKLFYSVKLNQNKPLENRNIKYAISQNNNSNLSQNFKIIKEQRQNQEIASPQQLHPLKLRNQLSQNNLNRPTKYTPSKHTSGGNDDKMTSYNIYIQTVPKVDTTQNKNITEKKNIVQKKIQQKTKQIKQAEKLIHLKHNKKMKKEYLLDRVQEIDILDTQISDDIDEASKINIKIQKQTLKVPSIRRITSINVESLQQVKVGNKIIKYFHSGIGKMLILLLLFGISIMLIIKIEQKSISKKNKKIKSNKLDKFDELNTNTKINKNNKHNSYENKANQSQIKKSNKKNKVTKKYQNQ